MKTVLVTGGAGFIGSHVVERLCSEGMKVRVLDNFSTGRASNLEHLKGNPHLELVEGSIVDKDKHLKLYRGVDWVIHLAALADIVPSMEMPGKYHEANVEGTLRVLESAREAGVKRFLYAASSSCYGIPDIYPTPETAEFRPQYPYALTKCVGEQYVMHWGSVYKLPVVSLRLFNVYGTRSRTSGTYGAVFGVFLAQKLKNHPFTVVGNGEQTRDFTYVTDVADAFFKAAQSTITQKIMNVGSGGHYSVNQIVKLLGGDVMFIPKRPGEPDCTFADISRIRRELNWKPSVTIEAGIKKLLENIDYWKEAPLWTPDKIKTATDTWFTYLGKKAA